MIAGIVGEGPHHAPLYVLAQASVELAAGTITDVSPSPPLGLLLVARLPSRVPGESDGHRQSTVSSQTRRMLASDVLWWVRIRCR
jgi:hypothetical protein